MKVINAFEAKTKFSELLRKVERGESFLICRRGKAVGKLVPLEGLEVKEIASRFRTIREGIRGEIDIREVIEQGRRF